jgi:putative phosphoribosyl transferase
MTSIKRNRYGPVSPVSIPLEGMVLHGDLRISDEARGLVIFVHGSGSSRFSPRNRHVAEELNERGLSTLLMDLLTDEEQKIDTETMQYRFDIPLLATRSTLVANWAQRQPEMNRLPIGLFGASTGAAAALITAAAMKEQIAAVVSRGGRPDLAEAALDKVKAPTLLIVGGEDETVLALNRKAMAQMRCISKLHVVPGATHLFEEPGTLEQVAAAAGEWFVKCMEERAAGTPHKAAG